MLGASAVVLAFRTKEGFVKMSFTESTPVLSGEVIGDGRFTQLLAYSNAIFAPFVSVEVLGESALAPRTYLPISDLVVEEVDTLNTQNKRAHHTDAYMEPELIVRRGQQFTIRVAFNQDMTDRVNSVYVKFEIGPFPDDLKNTKITLPSILGRESGWKMQANSSGHSVTLDITPSSDCIVGRFRMAIGIHSGSNSIIWFPSSVRDIYILFNPWAKQDIVHMPNTHDLNEYVLNQVGIIFNGTAWDPAAVPWNFGQINSQDDNGVIVGNWSGNYSGGTPPLSWIGSPPILLKYHLTKHSVKFGQCWVYAAVFNTFLRCLGIPSRVITNYRSAHDNDGNVKTDIIFLTNWECDRSRTKDSLWNYHCWNECYIDRDDLPAGLGGWQVNSDIVYYKPGPGGRLKIIYVDTSTVGERLLTKAVGSRGFEDVTHLYKFPEGTTESEMTVKNAEQYGCKRKGPYAPETDVKLKVEVSPATIFDGFNVTLSLISRANQTRTVDLYLSGNVVHYTGVHSSQFKFQNLMGTVDPGRTEHVTVQVEAYEYERQLVDQAMLMFIIAGHVRETERALISTKLVKLGAPKLTIQVAERYQVGELMTIKVEFTNTSNQYLTETYLHLEIAGVWVFNPKQSRGIAPGGQVSWTETFIPSQPMHTSVIASLYSKRLPPVYNDVDVVFWA
ncbi:hypothetical protein JZ751_003732 [Albula glossodonta]|uniref:Transglutaminase-like domain-containing protein n=1 Tax=Albula glossodonta TaxID=121402 RepID=A0A8T2PDZ5_9TELE|nr:hypothetical protein JZ751_003732 [Albula glossodonta]